MTLNHGVVGSIPTEGTKIEMMEREEILEFLREHMSIELSTSVEYESRGQYLNIRASINLDGEEIASDYTSQLIED